MDRGGTLNELFVAWDGDEAEGHASQTAPNEFGQKFRFRQGLANTARRAGLVVGEPYATGVGAR